MTEKHGTHDKAADGERPALSARERLAKIAAYCTPALTVFAAAPTPEPNTPTIDIDEVHALDPAILAALGVTVATLGAYRVGRAKKRNAKPPRDPGPPDGI